MSTAGTAVPAEGPFFVRALDRLSHGLNQGLAWLAAIALVGMVLLTVFDIVLRLAGMQVAGTYELVGWLAAAAMGLSLGYVQLYKGHVTVTIVTDRLRGRVEAGTRLLASVCSLGLIAVTAWYVGRFGLLQQTTGSLSETLRLVVYPWVFILTLGLVGLTLALLVDVLKALVQLINPRAFA